MVALKFLPDEFVATKADKERFLREARTASSLDHPNIGVIHGIEETPEGRTYIVMAFYEGETLARRISRGALPLGEALDIAIQIARGITEAHSNSHSAECGENSGLRAGVCQYLIGQHANLRHSRNDWLHVAGTDIRQGCGSADRHLGFGSCSGGDDHG
jgi:serine/threonine protein kinase